MTDHLIRDATPDDLAGVAAIYAHEVLHGVSTFELTPPSVEEMAARLAAVRSHGLPWLVAGDETGLLGYAYATPFRPRPAYRYACEDSVYVAERARGRGVGRVLLREVIDRARALGLRHVIGAISSGADSPSVSLHRSLGFREVGTYRQVGWKFDRWLDVTLMQLDLDPEAGPPRCEGLKLS